MLEGIIFRKIVSLTLCCHHDDLGSQGYSTISIFFYTLDTFFQSLPFLVYGTLWSSAGTLKCLLEPSQLYNFLKMRCEQKRTLDQDWNIFWAWNFSFAVILSFRWRNSTSFFHEQKGFFYLKIGMHVDIRHIGSFCQFFFLQWPECHGCNKM